MKISKVDPSYLADAYLFFCPGCECGHMVSVNGCKNSMGATWTWNQSMDKPTFSPSVFVNASVPERRCHSFVKDGQIQFLGDCFHALKNQTVEIPEWDDEQMP
jgi:hypothetical protein